MFVELRLSIFTDEFCEGLDLRLASEILSMLPRLTSITLESSHAIKRRAGVSVIRIDSDIFFCINKT